MPDEPEVFREDLPNDAWMVRPCEMYKAEYSDCTSYKARFHQYFIHGKTTDCEQWKIDFNNCMSWRKTQQLPFLESVIKSEQTRKLNRLTSMMSNDVWKRRIEPISEEEWNKPLPEWMTAKFASSFLHAKKVIDESEEPSILKNNWQCTIL